MKKKLFVTLIITLTTLLCTFACVNAEENINVTLNDEVVTFDTAPVMENDRILVPIRAIAEKMEFDVDWDEATETVTLENFNTILTLKINGNSITKDLKYASESYGGKISTIELDTPAKILNERTYIPLRAVTESFGCDVDWNQESQTAEIIYVNTYGEEVAFEDEGIEYLTKLELLLEGVLTRRNEAIQMTHYNDLIETKIKDCTADELYSLKIYEGALKKIEYLGMIDNGNICINSPAVYSLEDIKKFPNLKNICIENQHITDLSPITYQKEWKNLKIAKNPIFDFSPLLEVNITESLRFGYGQQIYHSPFLFDNISDYKNLVSILVEVSDEYQKVIDDNIKSNMTTKQKVSAISGWVSKNINYDYGYTHLESFKKKYSNTPGITNRWGALTFDPTMLTHFGVCQNYAATFEEFCGILDIPCICISGSCDGIDPYYNDGWGSHDWNVVKLEDGNFYHIDTTWGGEYINFLTSEELENFGDHKWNEEDIVSGFKLKYGSDF